MPGGYGTIPVAAMRPAASSRVTCSASFLTNFSYASTGLNSALGNVPNALDMAAVVLVSFIAAKISSARSFNPMPA